MQPYKQSTNSVKYSINEILILTTKWIKRKLHPTKSKANKVGEFFMVMNAINVMSGL